MTPKSRWIQKADSAWYEYQHLIWKRCAISGVWGVEIHHIISLGHKITRYDVLNGIGLSEDRHKYNLELSAHKTKGKFIEWLEKSRPKQYEYYQINQHRHGYSLTVEYYKQAYHRLKNLTRGHDDERRK